MARKITANTYRKERCPICNKEVSIQGKTNHMRKHGEATATKEAPTLPRSINVDVGHSHESYRQGYREGYQDGQRNLLERFKLLGFLDRLSQEELRSLVA